MLPSYLCLYKYSLFKNNTIQFAAINKAFFFNVSYCFKEDPAYCEIMRRHRAGKLTKEDIHTINTKFVENSDVTLPQITKLRCACYKNDERNAYNNVVFLKHLERTHQPADIPTATCPNHTCIIKARMAPKNKQYGSFNKNLYNRLLVNVGILTLRMVTNVR